ncbi:MAG: hypothetical protein R3F34_00590 [Planctomycetota bacterium]
MLRLTLLVVAVLLASCGCGEGRSDPKAAMPRLVGSWTDSANEGRFVFSIEGGDAEGAKGNVTVVLEEVSAQGPSIRGMDSPDVSRDLVLSGSSAYLEGRLVSFPWGDTVEDVRGGQYSYVEATFLVSICGRQR